MSEHPLHRAGRIRTTAKHLAPLMVAAGLVSGGTAVPAFAADSSELQQLEQAVQRLEIQHQEEIKALQAQIEQLKAQQAQIEQLKTQQTATDQHLEAVAVQQGADQTAAPHLVESPSHQFGLSSPDGQNSIALLARMQFDGADYFHTVPAGGLKGAGPGGLAGPLDSGVNARRARLGIGGVLEGDWAYRLIYDFGGSSDSLTPGVSGAVTSGVENAYLTYNGFNKPGNTVPMAADLGYLDVPWTLDEATSSNDIMFLERSSSQVVATEFGGGDSRSAIGLRSNNRRYWAGFYLTGPQSGAPHTGANVGSDSVLGRATYQLVQTDDATIHVGVNGAHLKQARANGTTTSANGISDIASNPALALSDRPELRVDPTVILNTGNIPARSGDVLGLEAAGSYGNFFTQGEFYHYTVNQRAGAANPADGSVDKIAPDLNFQGGYIEASYSFGGRRSYIAETGAYSGVIPEHSFSLDKSGWGALELAARFSTIDLNDHFTPGTAPHLTGGVDGGHQTGVDFGASWVPNRNVRFILDYIHTDVSDIYKSTTNGSAPSNPSGTIVNAIALRSQFLF